MNKLTTHSTAINFIAIFSLKKRKIVRYTYTFALFFILTALVPSISYAKKSETLKDSIFNLQTQQTNSIYIVEGTPFIGLKNNTFNYIKNENKNNTTSIIFIAPSTTFYISETVLKNFSIDNSIETSTIYLSIKNVNSQQENVKKIQKKTESKQLNTLENPFQNPYSLGVYSPNRVFITSSTKKICYKKHFTIASPFNNFNLNYKVKKYGNNHVQNSDYCYLIANNLYTRPPPIIIMKSTKKW